MKPATWLCLFLLFAPLFTIKAAAQRKLSPGEMIEIGGGQKVMIVECTGSDFNEECDVVFWSDTLSAPKRIKFSGRNIRAGEERVLKAKGLMPRNAQKTDPVTPIQTAPAATATARGRKVEVNVRAFWYKATVVEEKGDMLKVRYDDYNEEAWVNKSRIRNIDGQGNRATASCSFSPPPGNYTDASPASAGLFKRELFDYYNRLVNGTLSRPTRIGIVFSAFEQGKAYKNTVTNVPGRGATRIHDGAPANTTIYPVKASFMVCEDYNGTVTQKQVTADFSFFVNKDGEWTCTKDN